MLTIIHGTDISASRNHFLLEKQKATDAVTLNDKEIDLTTLSQILEGVGLFEDTKTLFIEQFITERKKSKEKDAISEYLTKQAKANNIYLWEGKELTTSQLTPFKNAAVKIFKLPPTLFAFLDAIKPGNSKELIALHHKALLNNEPEMIFFMLVRQFRLLLALSQYSKDTISEISRMAPWQKSKLEKQTKLFKKEQLIEIYSHLFKIETAQKTGNLSSSLTSTLDLFLIGV